MLKFGVILILVATSLFVYGQDELSLKISRATDKITLDGILDEASWQSAETATDFNQNFPADTSKAISKTEVKITFDDNNIYIGAICYDDLEGDYVVQSLKRDFTYESSDAFAVFIDPFNDKTNGFSFGVNPLGVQREGLLQDGGSFGISSAWDNKWFVKVSRENDRWIVEMAIPFKTIRFSESTKEWGINFGRNDLKRNESSTWSPVPRIFNVASLANTGKLIWDELPKKAGTNVAVIPYLTGGLDKDYDNNLPTNYKVNAGVDAKIAVTSSLNLDLTVNPDFSHVDVDNQVTNLSRFSIFFPEKRNFFIENSDLFDRFGFSKIRPFFSRKIGLHNGSPVPIIAGARLSGKLNKDWRIGLLNMQTEGIGEVNLKSQNYTVAAIQRRIGVRSNLAAIFVNRTSFTGSKVNFNDFSRIGGLDFNLASANNKWMGKAFYQHSFTPDVKDKSGAHAVWLMYNTKPLTVHYNHEIVGENFNAEVGFVPRLSNYNPETGEEVKKTYYRFEPNLSYRFYPKSKKLNIHGFDVSWSLYADDNLATTEHSLSTSYNFSFKDQSELRFGWVNEAVRLFWDTDITFSKNPTINAGFYSYNIGSLNYNSSPLKKLTYSMNGSYGSYYIGTRYSTGISFAYRAQPWGNFSIGLTQNNIEMPSGYSNANITLITPRIDLSFTKELFFTTFVQYNTQTDNLNINARFQYRFKPMSDLFIVYSDNYLPYNLSIKNRALVVKLVYWINL